jgi:hypothetical protein
LFDVPNWSFRRKSITFAPLSRSCGRASSTVGGQLPVLDRVRSVRLLVPVLLVLLLRPLLGFRLLSAPI